jgi:hypothetical protein
MAKIAELKRPTRKQCEAVIKDATDSLTGGGLNDLRTARWSKQRQERVEGFLAGLAGLRLVVGAANTTKGYAVGYWVRREGVPT